MKTPTPASSGGFTLFARLVESLLFTPSRNAKLARIADYLHTAPPPDRGVAIALLAGRLSIPTIRPAQLRRLATARVDPELFRQSAAHVGDLGETIALIWPEARASESTAEPPSPDVGLAELVERLRRLTPLQVAPFLDATLDSLDETGRWVFVKLITGSTLRIGLSASLTRQALAEAYEKQVSEIEQLWGFIDPPFDAIFQWIDGHSALPAPPDAVHFHPPMLATALDESDLNHMPPADYLAEWKWDGVRVQWCGNGAGHRRLYSRTGEDLSSAFPDVVNAFDSNVVIDAELLIRITSDAPESTESPSLTAFPAVAPFHALQKRLRRSSVNAEILAESPAFLCAYDILSLDGQDLRDLPLDQRRHQLQQWCSLQSSSSVVLSPVIPFTNWEQLVTIRGQARADGREGLMIKDRASLYRAGRHRGAWFKWKRDPLNIDAVVIYAQRGHGKRASYFSDLTFAVWTGPQGSERTLTPVGRAYSGFTDQELVELDKWIRDHTTKRYGASVRSVEAGLVIEVAFDALAPSTRHRSGVAMRFPRVHRIRWDKPAEEADTIESLKRTAGWNESV